MFYDSLEEALRDRIEGNLSDFLEENKSAFPNIDTQTREQWRRNIEKMVLEMLNNPMIFIKCIPTDYV